VSVPGLICWKAAFIRMTEHCAVSCRIARCWGLSFSSGVVAEVADQFPDPGPFFCAKCAPSFLSRAGAG
jgi:hypothetical protein